MLHLLHTIRRSPKYALMLGGIMILWLLGWQLGFKKTAILLSQYASIAGTADQKFEPDTQPEDLLNRLKQLDREMGCSEISGDDIRQSILERLSQSGRTCPFSMVDIPEGYFYRKQEYTVMINTFVVTGRYFDLLRLVYSIDTLASPFRLISVRMYVHKSYQVSRPELRLALIFQHLNKKNETQ